MANGTPTPCDLTRPSVPDAVADELLLLQRVLEILARPCGHRASMDYDGELIRLREMLDDERMPEDRASIAEQMLRVAQLKAQHAKSVRTVADLNSPYFGHLRLDYEDGRRRDVMIGKQTFVTRDVTIVDWRHAPIARVFYQSRDGDHFEMEVANRELSGRVLVRRTVTIGDGELRRVCGAGKTYMRSASGWLDLSTEVAALRGGAGRAERPDRTQRFLGIKGGVPAVGTDRRERADKHLPAIASLLDAVQYDLITDPQAEICAIQGSAGSGKTTVALHRVAYLCFADPVRFRPTRTQVIVFSRALAHYISEVLPALGVEGVHVDTFEEWARVQRRRHFPKIPDLYSDETPGVVTRFKLHTAMLNLLQDGVNERRKESPTQIFEELFTDRRWLGEKLRRYAPGSFTANEIETIHRWCTRQHFNRVDDGGVLDHEQPAIDPEDDAILLRLYQLTRGPLRYKKTRPLRYNHLVVDEVQDTSPIELRVLLDTVTPGSPITLAGDTAQKLDEDRDFQDWTHLFETLGLSDVRLATLNVSYRSTAQIMEVAREIVAPVHQTTTPLTMPRQGAPVELFRFSSVGEATTFLGDALQDLVAHEPSANLAVLTLTPQQAEIAYHMLQRVDIPRLRWVSDQDFAFAPGVEVTDIRQTKGLEFDYVVLIDCDIENYPATPSSRHLLHVGMTRAAHQCWLLSVGTPSRVIPRWLDAQR